MKTFKEKKNFPSGKINFFAFLVIFVLIGFILIAIFESILLFSDLMKFKEERIEHPTFLQIKIKGMR